VRSDGRARALLAEAEAVLIEARGAEGRGEWNLAVRRAQEAVELSLKAALVSMGADYPRVHDVGRLFARVAAERGAGLSEAELERAARVSAELALRRGPAFYLDAEYGREDALEAVEGGAFALGLSRRVVGAPPV
jgi:HEPN domain-containing protein